MLTGITLAHQLPTCKYVWQYFMQALESEDIGWCNFILPGHTTEDAGMIQLLFIPAVVACRYMIFRR